MKTTIKSILHNLKQKDAGSYQNRLMRYLLLATLVSIFVIIGINFVEFINEEYPEAGFFLSLDIAALIGVIGLWFLNQRGFTRLTGETFLLLGFIFFFLGPTYHTFNNTVLVLAIPIMISSFVISPISSVYMGIAAIILYSSVYTLNHIDEGQVSFEFEWFSLLVLFFFSIGSWIIARHNKKIIDETKTSRQMFADLVDQLPAFVYVVPLKPGSRATYISPHIETLTGFTVEEWTDDGERWASQIHPDDRERVVSAFEKSQIAHTPYELEYRMLTKEGRLIWVRDEAHVLLNDQKRPMALQGVLVDISQEKQSDETVRSWRTALENQVVERTRELADTQDRLKLVLESSTDGYWEWNVATGDVMISASLAKMLGYQVNEIPNNLQYWSQLSHPDDLSGVQQAMTDHLEGQAPFYEVEMRLRRKNGDWLWVRDRGRIVEWDDQGRIKKVVGTHTDIQARKQVEAALQRREAVLEAVGFAAARFLSNANWEAEMPAALEQLSKALEVTQASIVHLPNAPEAFWPFETYIPWPKSIVPERIAELPPHKQAEVMAAMMKYMAPLLEGKIVIMRQSEQPESIQKIMDIFGFASNLQVPIFYRGKFWGSISFSDSNIDREWAAPEIEACRIAALTLEAAIQNEATLKALEESQKNYQTLAENISELISMVDLEGRVIFTTPSSQSLFGVPADVMPGMDGLNFIHPDDLPGVMDAARTHVLGKKEPFTIVFRAFQNDGKLFWMEASVRPVIDPGSDQVSRLVAVCRDITARRETEEKLAERTEELSQANAELQRADEIKNAFLRNMSHDLKTPLSAILSVAEALQEQTYGPITDRQDDALKAIQISGEHLKRLINDAFDLSKLQAGMLKLDWQEISLEAVCQESVEIIRQLAEEKGLELSLEIEPDLPAVQADPLQLRRILVNLLGNAIKFTPTPGKIGLTVGRQNDLNQLRLTVWDTGIGISEADQAQLFRPFFQVNATGKRQGGSGLGLPLVKELSKLHGWDLNVESAPSQGSRFTVCIPLYSSNAHGARVEPQPRQILLVVDNPENTQVLYSRLSSSGYDVGLVRAGPEAVTAAGSEQPDIVLIDTSFPEARGLSVIQLLRTTPQTTHLPILALPTSSDAADRERCLTAGADAVLARPFHTRDLLELIERALISANGR